MAEQKFEYVDYEMTWSDAKLMLAELKYIDDVMEKYGWGEPGQPIQGQSGEDEGGTYMYDWYTFQLGTTHPFDWTGLVKIYQDDIPNNTEYDAVREDLDDISYQASVWANGAMNGLRTDLLKMVKPYAGDFASVAR